jgi:hypothetical protein
MRSTLHLSAAVAASFIAAGIGQAAAQAPAFAKVAVDGYYYHLPAGAADNLEAARALVAASDGMGMTRRSALTTGDNSRSCLGCSTDSFEYKGSGTFNGQKVKSVSIHFDLRIPAVRADVIGEDNKRAVTVAAGKLAWDESAPGVFAKPASDAAERLIPVLLLPPAAIVLGAAQADKIKVAMVGGDRVLTIPVPYLFADLKATLDLDGRVSRTEVTYGGKVYSGEYSEFQNDRMDYHVWGPHHIVQKVDGKVVTDLTLDYHWTNPYMIFPTPKELAQK